MAAPNTPVTIPIINGVAKDVTLRYGTYTLNEITVPGYKTASMESFEITPTTTAVTVRLTADGVLNVHVVDEKGDSIVSGQLQLCSSSPETRYGNVVEISDEGMASFANLPYDAEETIAVHIAQDATDERHIKATGAQEMIMSANPQARDLLNELGSKSVTLTLVDAVNEGIVPMGSGNLIITDEA